MRGVRTEREQARDALLMRLNPASRRRYRVHRALRGFTWFFIIQLTAQSKRILDLVVSSALLALTSPLWLIGAALAKATGGGLHRQHRLGRYCEPVQLLYIDSPSASVRRLLQFTGIGRMPRLINVVRGDLSLIGPRPLAPDEIAPEDRAFLRRQNVRPGLVGPWWIRRRANINYDREWDIDADYSETWSLRGDIGIALRALPALLYGDGVASAPDSLTIQSIPIHNLTMTDAIDRIIGYAADRGRPHQVVFVNAHCANIAWSNTEYLRVLKEADLSLADGIGLKLAGKLLKRDIKQNVNGTDLFPRLCQTLSGTGMGLYLLGAREGVAAAVADWVRRSYPDVIISGVRHGYFDAAEEAQVIREIRESGASVLLVAFGVPRQDVWIHQHLQDLSIPVSMGVGGLFDFYSGRITRAPQWVREIGMEWCWRLLMEPARMWRRYVVGNGIFLAHVLYERITGRGAPADRALEGAS